MANAGSKYLHLIMKSWAG